MCVQNNFSTFAPNYVFLRKMAIKLSIITINRNNAHGLQKTMQSVLAQTYQHFEYVVVDGASTDNSIEIIKQLEQEFQNSAISLKWISEPDKGIYNAMNKGIRIANGEYLEFLNSGDLLAADTVVEKMMSALSKTDDTDIIYGNMIKVKDIDNISNLKIKNKQVDSCGSTSNITLKMFYRGCLNHSPAYIKKSLFDQYGLYDETLKICSDWKFYMQSVVLGSAKVMYVNLDVTIFDMNGISETRKDILENERQQLLSEMIPRGILSDYDKYHFAMSQYDRLKRHHLWGVVYFMERVLFKLEKWHIIKKTN